ncbi:MAG: AMP-binding protein, partial [bacterium]|nr:AMP-binding protein [bacterium]
FDHILVFENYPVSSALQESPPGLEITEAQPWEQTNYPLTVLVLPGPELRLRMEYDRRHFDAGMIRRLLGHWRELLRGFVAAGDPPRRLAELSLLSAAERWQIVGEWNVTAEDYPLERCLHELVETQVARTPEAVAVVFDGEALSYRELDRRTDALARVLERRGAGRSPGAPDVLVGVLMERSVELVVALLGILKAGGAYLPLDPSYPRERLSFMVRDAGSPAGRLPVILTQERLREVVPETP